MRGIEGVCDLNHVRNLLQECGAGKCKGKETPLTKEGPDQSVGGESLGAGRSRSARRGIAASGVLNHILREPFLVGWSIALCGH